LRDKFATGLFLGVGLLGVYLFVGGRGTIAADSIPNMLLACSIVRDFDSTFTPEEAPSLFRWQVLHEGHSQEVLLTRLDPSTRELIRSGQLEFVGPTYLSVESRWPGRYVSTFPPGASWMAVPAYLAGGLFVGDVAEHPRLMWWIGRGVAALCAAGSGVFVYATCRRIASNPLSLLLTMGYALGTSVWTTSSQGLWQHGPAELLAAAAIYLLSNGSVPVRHPAMMGALLGGATLCRSTYGGLVLTVGLYLLWVDRAALMRYIAGGLPWAMFLAAYNAACFGSPFLMGEALVPDHAISKTGSDGVFSTPIWIGLATSLISPNRGLLVFSPMLALGMVGWWRSGLARVPRWIGSLVGGALLMTWIQSVYFDYWGGWCYGNRNLVDTVVVWMPAVTWGLATQAGCVPRWMLGIAIAWGIGLQALGAFYYSPGAWNGRILYRVGEGDRSTITHREAEARRRSERGEGEIVPVDGNIDRPENRYRLWSLRDSQMGVILDAVRRNRPADGSIANEFVLSRAEDRSRNLERLAQAFEQVGHRAEAERQRSLAKEVVR
jgi:hypothetical protein